jgi:Protein of unknown function (DUF1553)/Protein of unknown function (DUF1549)/Planctomycete cytochrome C
MRTQRKRMGTLENVVFLLAAGVLPAAPALPGGQDTVKIAFFEKKVRPILVGHCYTCHSADTRPAGGLRVDDRNGLLTGGATGPAIVPGSPAKSLLLQKVSHKDVKKRMPREGQPLSTEQINDLTQWITEGAAWPVVGVPASFGKPSPFYEKLKREHWAWQPLTDPKVPPMRLSSWPVDDIDRFLLAALEAKDLKPVGPADRESLLRRVTFDLTGLPPTPREIDAFAKDASAEAFARVVDRLLAAPAFGERWGRHWLDVARYGESTGPSRNIPYPHAWKYRDYVIDAVNAGLPFDRFLREQIAGDLLPASSSFERNRLLSATGFLALGVKDVNQRFKVRFVMDNVDEQIDVVTRSVLALTVSCARCHNHKFDPVLTTDYYALAGIFTSTDTCSGLRNKMGGGGLDYYDPSMLLTSSDDLPPVPAEEVAKRQAELAVAKKAWDMIRGTPDGLSKGPDGFPKQRPYRLQFERLEAEVLALTDPVARGLAVHGLRDAKEVANTAVRIRGEAEKLGPTVPRGFLTVFEVPGAPRVNPRQSGRLELAQWLTSPNNPLTARVIVNRVWQRLFGQGIVTTVDNFGATGARPSHPELLDHLASRFLRDGWSVKRLIRTLVLTRAYQLATDATPAHLAADPANRLIWRHSPRRLDAEELRDAMLAAAGTLDAKRPTASPARNLKMIEITDNGPEARGIHEQADRSTHRSIYLPLLRGVTPHAIEAFDPVEQGLVTGQRNVTTVPGQALFLLNSSFVGQQSLALAQRLLGEPEVTDADRIRGMYRATLGRAPLDKETERVRAFLTGYESVYRNEPVERRPAEPQTRQPADGRTAAWVALAQSLFAAAEFCYLK